MIALGPTLMATAASMALPGSLPVFIKGAFMGFTSSALSGASAEEALTAAIIGGISAGIADKIGGAFPKQMTGFERLGKSFLHGVTQGFMSEARGGSFRSGFWGGFVGSMAEGPLSSIEGGGAGKVFARTAIAATAGGISAELGGGKFANGATTAAFSYMFGEMVRQGEGGSPSSVTASGSQSPDPNRVWVNPTGGKVRGCDSQGCGAFGADRRYGPHQGADFEAIPGQNVVAVTDGIVDKVGYPYADDLSFRYVRIITSDGYVVRQLYVAPASGISAGASVSAGQVIGTSQGLGTRYPKITEHVHVDIHHSGKPVNPVTLIPIP